MGGWDDGQGASTPRRTLERLRQAAPGFTDEVILASLVKSPADIEELNPHMIHGAFHGGNRGPGLQRGAAPGAGLGLAPDADPGALPDRRDHASRRIHHRRPGP